MADTICRNLIYIEEKRMKSNLRNIENYFPFVLPIKVVPMLFIHNLEKKFLTVEIKAYLDDNEFNTSHESNFELLSDKATFQGSLYEGLLQSNFPTGGTFAEQLNKLEQVARKIAKFQSNDTLLEIKVDSEETFVQISGQKQIGGVVDLAGDPTVIFGSAQNKFDLLKQQNPEMTQLLYLFVLSVFAIKESPKQKFYKVVLQNLLK